MKVFESIFSFMIWLLNVSVDIDGLHFSLGGSIVFATIILIFIGFIFWLLKIGD